MSLLLLGCLTQTVLAQVPETGRWQDLAFTAEEFQSLAAVRYKDVLAGFAKQGRLDDDPAVLKRVQRVLASLMPAAVASKPAARAWAWEVHVTSDASIEAISMAGGKLLISSAFVQRLGFNDGELATLLGHEMAHALAEHHREEVTEALHITHGHPARSVDSVESQLDADLSLQLRLAGLWRIQESEADQLGMDLAHRAGWPSSSMVSFYEKLAAAESADSFDRSHPPAASRVSLAKAMALLFDR